MQIPVFIVHCLRIRKTSLYQLRFPINNQLTDRIKELPHITRRWVAMEYAWELNTLGLFLLIKRYKGSNKIHFDFGTEDSRKIFIQQIKKVEAAEEEKRKFIADLNIKKEHWVKYKQELEATYIQYSDKMHALLNEGVKLYPHQIQAALFANATRNTLISHEMGLGKSLSSILYVEMNGFEKVVVITPNSLKFNYFSEVEKFTKSISYIVGWRRNKCTIEDAKYVIVNYDFFNSSNKDKFLAKWKKLGIDSIDAVICDESQKLKNTKANTYKNFNRTFNKLLFKSGKISKIFLSGTPAPNRAYELYTVLNQISPVDFATKEYFYEYYCGMTYDHDSGWGYVTNSAEAKLEELYHKAAPYTHRKRKFEVLLDLPDKIYQKIMFEMDDNEYATYNEIEEGVANEFVLHPNGNPLTTMLRLRQYTASLKIKQVIELVENILETGEKVVIVDYFKDALYELKEKLGDVAALHTGDQKDDERADIVKKFQDPDSDLKVFLGTVQTCGYGLNLFAASKLFFMTLPYSVGEYDQVSDRLHRIGQKAVVNIYPLMFRDTIDDYVFSSIESKRKEITKVIDNEDYTSNVEESVLTEVIKKIKEKHGK
ncbi:MAG: DEAD/DEAH box helicase [Candidatus Paceibacterota bacterium]